MKIVIFGGRGYIGGKLKNVFPGAILPDTDIADEAGVLKVLDEVKPDCVINAAGKTGRPNVDWCEDHKEETLRSNVTGPLILLDACMKRNIYFVHIGSGCIYDGDASHEFTEEDTPNFSGSFYSFTKLVSDQALTRFPVLQLRLRMPFEGEPNPRNLISKLLKYKKVLDAANSLTYIPDFLAALKTLADRRATGIFNVTNPGAISPYQVMLQYKKEVDPSHEFERLTLADLPTVTKAGRSNCVLSSRKLEQAGIAMKPVAVALSEALHGFKR